MLAARSLRSAIKSVHSSQCIWLRVRTLSKHEPFVMGWIPRPLAINYSKDAKTTEIFPESSSIKKTDTDTKTKSEDCSTGGAVANVGVKLPSKDQMESFLFKSLVYFWDFSYYVFCLCRKLIETHVVKNETVQTNWKQLLKRMEDARKDIKSK